MIIEYKGNPPYNEFTLEDNVLTINCRDFDLDELRADSEVVIDVIDENNYVANIIIPPNEYETVQDGLDENGNPKYIMLLKPLNLDKVKLILWSKNKQTIEEV